MGFFVFLAYEEAAKLGKLATRIKSRYRNSALFLDRIRIFELASFRNYYYHLVTRTSDWNTGLPCSLFWLCHGFTWTNHLSSMCCCSSSCDILYCRQGSWENDSMEMFGGVLPWETMRLLKNLCLNYMFLKV